MALMERRRVYLHVGTPKSGTSYLQDKLALNRERLEEHGLDYVRTRSGDHFEAALDLTGQRWAGAERAASGQWDALATQARRSPHHVVVSHEILAGAPADAVARALASFPDHEPHVVVTARDLGRQIPAEWQERVKHRAKRDFAAYLDHTRRTHGNERRITPFWRVQDVPRILGTWGAPLPHAHVHLVTVGSPDSPPGLLWQRFADVLGIRDAASYAESPTTNASLGSAEVTLLRRLNAALAEREVPRATYVEWVRETIVKEALAGRSGSARASVPPTARPWVDDLATAWIERIGAMGLDVVGDLAELRTVWPPADEPWDDPDAVDPGLVADAAIEALAHVLDRIGTRPVEPTPIETGPVGRITRRWRG
jgi:hypothetical protein